MTKKKTGPKLKPGRKPKAGPNQSHRLGGVLHPEDLPRPEDGPQLAQATEADFLIGVSKDGPEALDQSLDDILGIPISSERALSLAQVMARPGGRSNGNE